MTQSDYEDPLAEILNTICFDYSRAMYQELGTMRITIQLILDALNIHQKQMQGNPRFQKILDFVNRLEKHRTRFLNSVRELEREISCTIQKIRTTQIIKVGEHIHYQHIWKRVTASELVPTIQTLQDILYELVTIISVLQTHTYIIEKHFERMQLNHGIEDNKNFHIAMEKLNRSVQIIRHRHAEVREALNDFQSYLDYAIDVYA